MRTTYTSLFHLNIVFSSESVKEMFESILKAIFTLR